VHKFLQAAQVALLKALEGHGFGAPVDVISIIISPLVAFQEVRSVGRAKVGNSDAFSFVLGDGLASNL
jgi:hypothetical protein